MSLISDALQKAQEQRGKSQFRISDWNSAALGAAQERTPPARTSSSGFFFANLAVLAAVCVVALYFFRDRSASVERTAPNVATTSVPAPATEQKPELSTAVATSDSVSPTAAAAEIAPAPAPAVAMVANEPPVTTDYELGGTSSLGSNTLLSIIRKEDKRSLWVAVGKTVGEVTAVSYDPSADRAVIRVRGSLLSIASKDSARADPATHPAE